MLDVHMRSEMTIVCGYSVDKFKILRKRFATMWCGTVCADTGVYHRVIRPKRSIAVIGTLLRLVSL